MKMWQGELQGIPVWKGSTKSKPESNCYKRFTFVEHFMGLGVFALNNLVVMHSGGRGREVCSQLYGAEAASRREGEPA